MRLFLFRITPSLRPLFWVVGSFLFLFSFMLSLRPSTDGALAREHLQRDILIGDSLAQIFVAKNSLPEGSLALLGENVSVFCWVDDRLVDWSGEDLFFDLTPYVGVDTSALVFSGSSVFGVRSYCSGDGERGFTLAFLLCDDDDSSLGYFPCADYRLSWSEPVEGATYVSFGEVGFWLCGLGVDQWLVALCGWMGFVLLFVLIFRWFLDRSRGDNVLLMTLLYGFILLLIRAVLLCLSAQYASKYYLDGDFLSPINLLVSGLFIYSFSYYCYRVVSLYRWHIKKLSLLNRGILFFLGELYNTLSLLLIHLSLVALIVQLKLDMVHPMRMDCTTGFVYLGCTLMLSSLIIRGGGRRWHERCRDVIMRTIIRVGILLIAYLLLGETHFRGVGILIGYLIVSRFALWFWFSRFGVNGYFLVILFFALYWVVMVAVLTAQVSFLDIVSLFCYLLLYLLVGCRVVFWLFSIRSLTPWIHFSFVSRIHLVMVYLVAVVILLCLGVGLFVWVDALRSQQAETERQLTSDLTDLSGRFESFEELHDWFSLTPHHDLALYHADGTKCSSYDSLKVPSVIDRESFARFLADSTTTIVPCHANTPMVYIRTLDRQQTTCGYMAFVSEMGQISDNSFRVIERFINLFMIVLVCSFIVSVLLYRILTCQVATLRDAMASAGVMQKVKLEGKCHLDYEFRELINKYNLMVEYLQQSYRVVARYERESLWQQMAQRMAHEIKNPLTPMKLKVQMLQRVDPTNQELYRAKSEQTLRLILRQIDIIDAAVDEFRDFAHAHKSDPTTINLVSVVMGVALVYDNYKGASVKVRNRWGLPLWIYADSNQISRLFANLCKNGAEATSDREGGLVEIILDRDTNGNPLVVVRDNGRGIPLEQRSKLFEANFTTKGDGNGLGLSISKEIVERWGGTIGYQNRPMGGTAFTVGFPSCLN